MCVVLGGQEMEEVEAMAWVDSDPDSDKPGQIVPQDILDHAVTLGDRGLLETEGQSVGIQEISQRDVSSFAERAKGSLGDLRTLGDHRDGQKRQFRCLTTPSAILF